MVESDVLHIITVIRPDQSNMVHFAINHKLLSLTDGESPSSLLPGPVALVAGRLDRLRECDPGAPCSISLPVVMYYNLIKEKRTVHRS